MKSMIYLFLFSLVIGCNGFSYIPNRSYHPMVFKTNDRDETFLFLPHDLSKMDFESYEQFCSEVGSIFYPNSTEGLDFIRSIINHKATWMGARFVHGIPYPSIGIDREIKVSTTNIDYRSPTGNVVSNIKDKDARPRLRKQPREPLFSIDDIISYTSSQDESDDEIDRVTQSFTDWEQHEPHCFDANAGYCGIRLTSKGKMAAYRKETKAHVLCKVSKTTVKIAGLESRILTRNLSDAIEQYIKRDMYYKKNFKDEDRGQDNADKFMSSPFDQAKKCYGPVKMGGRIECSSTVDVMDFVENLEEVRRLKQENERLINHILSFESRLQKLEEKFEHETPDERNSTFEFSGRRGSYNMMIPEDRIEMSWEALENNTIEFLGFL